MNEQNNTGWVCIWRKLLDNPLWKCSKPEQKTILVTLLLMANHSPNEWEYNGAIYKVQAGQFVTSLQGIVDKCGKGVTVQNVRTALKRFEKFGFLTDKSTNQNRLITIVNWSQYQVKSENSTNGLTGSQQTANKQLIGNQQAANRHLTTNNNDKNVNNENNDKNDNNMGADKPHTSRPHFLKPHLDEISEYCRERNNNIDAQRFFDYYEANGWKVGKNPMQDWKAAVRTWERNNYVFGSGKEKNTLETSGSIFIDAAAEFLQSQEPII